MEAGIHPDIFWDMTPAEIQGVIAGHRKRAQWQALQTYMIVSCWSKEPLSPSQLFPGLFDDIQAPEQPWQIMKENLLAHRNDYKRNQGDKA